MPRPRKCRRVCCLPRNVGFEPVQGSNEHAVVLTVDEYEALRLIDREGFSQEECGKYMQIARTTVQQIYTIARKKLADALVEGRALRIEGGDYRLCDGEEDFCGCRGNCPRHRRNCMKINETAKREGTEMKIAVPLDENKTDVCVTFGRAPYFLFWEDGKSEIVENPAAEAQGGAGLKTAQLVVDHGATVLVTVRCGENAAEVFKAADIAIYKAEGSNAVENCQAMSDGKLEKLTHFHAGFQGIQ